MIEVGGFLRGHGDDEGRRWLVVILGGGGMGFPEIWSVVLVFLGSFWGSGPGCTVARSLFVFCCMYLARHAETMKFNVLRPPRPDGGKPSRAE